MTSTTTFDAVVVGAGVIGLSCAWRLGERGLRVAAVDPRPGQGASAVAAGMLAPVTELHYGEESLLRLNLASAARYPSFVAEVEQRSGQSVGYRDTGTLAVALDAADRAALHDLADFQQRLGLASERLTGRECRRLEPMLAPDVQGGVLVTDDHQVDPRRLTAALLGAAEAAGVSVLRHSVERVLTNRTGVTGVTLDDGSTLAAGCVVVAAGSHSALPGLPEDVVPTVRPVKGQVIRLHVPGPYRPLLTRTVRGMVHGFPVYLVPREDGELVVGATQEELGFDETVTAGGVYQLLRDAHTLVPAITELPLVETRAGLRPGSPDNAPAVGPTSIAGLVLAVGHYRNGILLTPLTADAVEALVLDGALPEPMAPFTPQRFAVTATEARV